MVSHKPLTGRWPQRHRPRAKLHRLEVRDIRAFYAAGRWPTLRDAAREIAGRWRISVTAVEDLLRGHTWVGVQ